MWLLENKFPFDEHVFSFAVLNKNIEILKWLLKNDFPRSEIAMATALDIGNKEIIDFLIKNGFPYDRYEKKLIRYEMLSEDLE